MKGVMIPVVSAGSNQVGASETCTAHVSWPSGAAGAAAGATSPRSSPTTGISAEREIERRGSRSVMRILLASRTFRERSRGTTNGTRSATDYAQLAGVVNAITNARRLFAPNDTAVYEYLLRVLAGVYGVKVIPERRRTDRAVSARSDPSRPGSGDLRNLDVVYLWVVMVMIVSARSG